MALKTVYDNEGDIPEQHKDLFSERNGKWELTGIEGVKTQADIDRLQGALTKERNDHKDTKDQLAKFDGLDPDEIHTKLDRLPELEAAAGDKLDEAKIEEIVEGRIRTKLAPVERERDKAIKERDAALIDRDGLKTEIKTRDIRGRVTDAAVKANLVGTALDDALMLADRVFEVNEDGTVTAKDNMGVTPGIDPVAWFQEMQDKRPHWWPPSEGGGAGGGSGGGGSSKNPWKGDQWNMTEQGRIYRENPEQASRLAKLAGTDIGGPKPSA